LGSARSQAGGSFPTPATRFVSPQHESVTRSAAAGGGPGWPAPLEHVSIAAVEERSRRIVRSAVELAEKGGFDAVRLRDVAAHAGVALGTLYRRFRSKEDLLLAALEEEVREHERRIAQRPPAGDTPLERVVAFFESTTRSMCRRPNLTRALVRALAKGDPELTGKVAAFHTRLEEMMAAALRGQSPGRDGPPTEEERAIADVLQAVWFSALVGWAGGLHGQAQIVGRTRAAAEFVLRDAAR